MAYKMIRRAFHGVVALLYVQAAYADIPATVSVPALVTVTVKQGTPVEMMATKEISTADAAPGMLFRLRINKPVMLDARTLIPEGAWAIGEVLSATPSGRLGRSGQMTTRLLYVETAGSRIPLLCDMAIRGRGAGSAAIAVRFAGIAGLFHRGNNAKIKAGELVYGTVAQDTALTITRDTVQHTGSP